jgi:hypothetical protein
VQEENRRLRIVVARVNVAALKAEEDPGAAAFAAQIRAMLRGVL